MEKDVFDCMDKLASCILDVRVEIMMNFLLVHSHEIDRFDVDVVRSAIDRTAGFLDDYANSVYMAYCLLDKAIKRKEIVPVSFQLGGVTDSETMIGTAAP